MGVGLPTRAKWSQTTFLRGLDEIEALKREDPGKDIYLPNPTRGV
jgi:hypothetical protein